MNLNDVTTADARYLCGSFAPRYCTKQNVSFDDHEGDRISSLKNRGQLALDQEQYHYNRNIIRRPYR